MGSKGLLVTGVLMFIDLFLPWECVDLFGGLDIPGQSGNICVSGFGGLGVIVAILVIALIVWEALLAAGVAINMGTTSPALIGAALGGAAALFGIISFLTSLSNVAWGAFLGLIFALAMAYAAYVRFQESKVGGAAPPPAV
jgi:hypothetical protein